MSFPDALAGQGGLRGRQGLRERGARQGAPGNTAGGSCHDHDGARRANAKLLVRGLAERSIPKAEARKLYEDVTPPGPAEVAEARRLDRLLAPREDAGRPDKRERRDRIRRRGAEDGRV